MNLKTKPIDLSSDPVEVFERLVSTHECCFLLETLAEAGQSRTSGQSYIGVAPEHHFAARNGRFYADGDEEPADNPYRALSSKIDFDRKLPAHYVGGLVGYFSHEAIRYMEPSVKLDYPRTFADFEFGQYDDGLVFRRGAAPGYFHYGPDRSGLYQAVAPAERSAGLEIDFTGASKSESQYRAMVDQARQDIQNGRVFQVVLANKYEYRFSGALIDLYKQLRLVNPSAFMFFMKFGDVITMGASPELLVHSDPAGRTSIEALAGTIKRGKTPAEDAALARELLSDPKEIAEHNMLVDLARNDVGRVSQIGSVKIDDLMYIKQLSHVQHICSLVSGRLERGRTAFDALAAAFPAGTLVGAPKIEAAKMITELEGYERGPYGGTVGYFGYNGDSMHAVNIRSLNAIGNKLFLHTGSGIVYDSQAGREYREISDKKVAMDQAMAPFLKAGPA
jgi:anthranilate synthase component 1